MKKFLAVSVLMVIVAAPVWAVTITPGPVFNIPEVSVTAPTRPAIDDGRIVVGQYAAPAANGKAAVFSLVDAPVIREWGSNSFPNWNIQPSGYGQNNTVGIAGNWVGLGGAPTANAQNNPIRFANILTNTVYSYAATNGSIDEHFPDVNSQGEAIWLRWNPVGGTPSGGYSIMYVDLANNPAGPPVALPLTGVPTDSANANWSDDGRRIIYSNATQHRVFDMATNTDYLVFDKGASSMNILRARISDDGQWAVTNTRPEGEGSKRANLILYDLRNLNAPVRWNLTGNDLAGGADVIREDPTIEVIDADTAIIVWGQCTAPEASNLYDIRGAVVTGLLSTPVLGPVVTIASDTVNLHFPDIDKNIVTWVKDWNWLSGGGSNSSVAQYTYIPEPASLSLLALGSLVLRRRR